MRRLSASGGCGQFGRTRGFIRHLASISNRRAIYCSIALGVMLIVLLSIEAQNLSIPDNPLRGRYVFEQKGCINCHAISGEGGAVGPDLGQRKFYGRMLELASIMWNHSPEMLRRMRQLDLPYPTFSRDEIRDLIAYLYYLRYLGEPGDLYRGRLLVEKKSCLACHSVGGKGGITAPAFDGLAKYISPLFLAQALWNHGPTMDQEIRKLGLRRPTFERGEIVDLSAYLRSASQGSVRDRVYMSPGNPRRGSEVLRNKHCLSCHAEKGIGQKLAPDFADMDWNFSVTEIAGLMWNHGVEMGEMMAERKMSWPLFDGREMSDLISHLYFLGFEDREGNRNSGEQVFFEKGCVHCHVETTKGSQAAPDLNEIRPIESPSEMAAVLWNHAPAMEEGIIEGAMEWPEMTGNEMTDLFRFFREKKSK